MVDLRLNLFLFVTAAVIGWYLLSVLTESWGRYQNRFTKDANANLEKMFLFVDSNRVFFINISLLIVAPVGVYLLTGVIFHAVVALCVAIALPKIMLKVMENRRKQQILNTLSDALAQIAGSMRSGSTFTNAIEHLVRESRGPIAQEFGLFLKEQKIGITVQDSLENLAERVDLEEMDLVVAAALVSRDVGGNLADTLIRLSMTLRQKLEMEGKIKALTAQGKLQGWVVSALPFGIMFALTFIEPQAIQPIFTSFLGWAFLAVILLLEAMGAIMIRKIVSIDV